MSGICASRIVERFGRPVFMFAPDATAGNWVGSGRSIDGLHLIDAMDAMRAIDPSIWIAGGGHAAAGGCTIVPDGLERFAELFDAIGREQLPANAVGPRLLSDGEVSSVYLTLRAYEALEILEPTGRGFEPPQFHGRFDAKWATVPIPSRHALAASQTTGSRRLTGIRRRTGNTLCGPWLHQLADRSASCTTSALPLMRCYPPW